MAIAGPRRRSIRHLAAIALALIGSHASAQGASVRVDRVASAGDEHTFRVSASWWGIPDGGNGNLLAGFRLGLDLTSETSVAFIGSELSPYLELGSDLGTWNDADSALEGVSGGQLAHLFGVLPPRSDRSNPIHLFDATFRFDIDSPVRIDPILSGYPSGVFIYDDAQSGVTTGAPDDLPLDVVPWTSVPAPSGVLMLTIALGAHRRILPGIRPT